MKIPRGFLLLFFNPSSVLVAKNHLPTQDAGKHIYISNGSISLFCLSSAFKPRISSSESVWLGPPGNTSSASLGLRASVRATETTHISTILACDDEPSTCVHGSYLCGCVRVVCVCKTDNVHDKETESQHGRETVIRIEKASTSRTPVLIQLHQMLSFIPLTWFDRATKEEAGSQHGVTAKVPTRLG